MALKFKYDPNHKGGRKKKSTFNPDTFFCSFTLSNSEDATQIKHTFQTNGNKEGIQNYFSVMFNYLFYNHYKPVLQSKKRPYQNTIDPINLHRSANKHVLKEGSKIKSGLIDRAVLPPLFPPLSVKLSTDGRKKLIQSTLIERLSTLTPEQLDKLIELVS